MRIELEPAPTRPAATTPACSTTCRVLQWSVALLLGHALLGADCDRAVPVGGTFSGPIYATAPVGDARLFVVERAGTIRVLDENRNQLPTPFLDIRSTVSTARDGGLLSMAFPPDYAQTGRFYVYYTNLAGDSVLSRFRRSRGNPDVADTDEQVVLTVDQSAAGLTIHNGGTIAFSPVDGMLYWALGDGSGANDPDNLAQNPGTLLGKMLRIDVSGGKKNTYSIPSDNPFVGADGVLDEIWALGFRNPFRWSFDRELGDLWIGDVGQSQREEVDFEPAGEGGRNYGWKIHEGSVCYLPQPGLPCEDPSSPDRFTFPLYEYASEDGSCAIIGGVVHRGSIESLRGAYLFSDACSNRIWALGGQTIGLRDLTSVFTPRVGSLSQVVAFGEDGFGETYIVSLGSGRVFRMR
jgi:glucose/arabinose dehydrogenase